MRRKVTTVTTYAFLTALMMGGSNTIAAEPESIATQASASTAPAAPVGAVDADRVMIPFRNWWYRGQPRPAGDSDAGLALARFLRDHDTDPETLLWAARMQEAKALTTNKSPAELLQKAVDSGYPPAKAELGSRLLTNKSDPEKARLGLRLLEEAYAARDPDAAIQLGIAALTGAGGVPKDDARAEKLLGEGLAWGSIQAHWGLAEVAARAIAYPRAMDELRAGAEAGDGRCMIKLASIFRAGQWGQERNPLEAIKYMKMAADYGNAGMQRDLAKAILAGYGGLKHDEVEAKRLIVLAAKGGDPEAMLTVAIGEADGTRGFDKNESNSNRYIASLLTMEYPPALYHVAKQKLEATPPPSAVERSASLSLMRRAAAAGFKPASDFLAAASEQPS